MLCGFLTALALLPVSTRAFRNPRTTSAPRIETFLRSIKQPLDLVLPYEDDAQKSREGVVHYRVLPGYFPKGMSYHFDGLATVMKVEFVNGSFLHVTSKIFESAAGKSFESCDFFGTGTGPTKPLVPHICFQNPGVNLLPVGEDNLWLTIDTASWGQMNPKTLETLPGKVDTKVQTLNAHPACDHDTNECFVQHPCDVSPLSRNICFSRLLEAESGSNGDLKLETFANAKLDKSVLLQHSHSPCITENFLVSKVDRFTFRNPLNNRSGLLKFAKQAMSNEWMVTSRPSATRKVGPAATRILRSNMSFVNNHFSNCFEDTENKRIVIDLVGVTDRYLDSYFLNELQNPAQWGTTFTPAQRCYVPLEGDEAEVSCEKLLDGKEGELFFDYPTFNPRWKSKSSSRYVYAIAGKPASKWFDSIIKIDSKTRSVAKTWSLKDTYVTEASFVPRPNHEAGEDDGWLVSVIHTEGSSSSQLLFLDAKTLETVSTHDLKEIIPFHAHGVSCLPTEGGKKKCFANP